MARVSSFRRPFHHPGQATAVLVVATVALIAASAPAGAAKVVDLWLAANGADVRSTAEVEGLPEPDAVEARTGLSGGAAEGASGKLTGRRTYHPVLLKVRKPIDKVISKAISDAHRSGRPLPELRVQGRSLAGRTTTWTLHQVRIKTYICPSDPGIVTGRSVTIEPIPRSRGTEVAMEEITLTAEGIYID